MISRLFNASFKESKELIYEPNILKSSKRNKNEPTVIINSFRDTCFFPVMMFLVLVATYFVYSPSNRILMVGINSVLVAYILFMFYGYPRLHYKNWANMEKKRLPVILAYVLAFFLCTYPFLKDCSFEYSGSISMAFQAALWVSVIITCYYWYIKIPLEDLKPTSISKMAGRI